MGNKELREWLESEVPEEYNLLDDTIKAMERVSRDYVSKNPYEKFFIYKLSAPYKNEPNWKLIEENKPVGIFKNIDEYRIYDPGEMSDLLQEIYKALWFGASVSTNGKIAIWFNGASSTNARVGLDAMTSVQTSLNNAMKFMEKKSVKLKEIRQQAGYKQWSCRLCILLIADLSKENLDKKFYELINHNYPCMELFINRCFTIGNYCLVPAGFNSYRGFFRQVSLGDYWDLSLDCLAYNKDWIQHGTLKTAKENKTFVTYINMLFLWDYVDENYEVNPLFLSHKKRIGSDYRLLSTESVYPKDKSEINEFLDKIQHFIARRGKFMVAMLKIALGMNYNGRSEEEYCGKYRKDEGRVKYKYCGKYQNEWEDWNASEIYKLFMDKIFLKDEVYAGGYSKVIEQMKNEVKGKISDEEEKWLDTILEELCKYYNI